MVLSSKNTIAAQRDKLSLLSRMVLSRSTITMEGTCVTVSVDPDVADLMVIERIGREITSALETEHSAEVVIHVPW